MDFQGLRHSSSANAHGTHQSLATRGGSEDGAATGGNHPRAPQLNMLNWWAVFYIQLYPIQSHLSTIKRLDLIPLNHGFC